MHRPVLHRLRENVVQESGTSGAGSGHPCSPEEPTKRQLTNQGAAGSPNSAVASAQRRGYSVWPGSQKTMENKSATYVQARSGGPLSRRYLTRGAKLDPQLSCTLSPKARPQHNFSFQQSAARGQETKPLHRIKGMHRPVLHRLREKCCSRSRHLRNRSGHAYSPEEPTKRQLTNQGAAGSPN